MQHQFSALDPAPPLIKPCIFMIIDKKKPVYYIVYKPEEKRSGRCCHTVDIYSEKPVCVTKAALEHTTAKELLRWRPCMFRPGLLYSLLIHTLLQTVYNITKVHFSAWAIFLKVLTTRQRESRCFQILWAALYVQPLLFHSSQSRGHWRRFFKATGLRRVWSPYWEGQ